MGETGSVQQGARNERLRREARRRVTASAESSHWMPGILGGIPVFSFSVRTKFWPIRERNKGRGGAVAGVVAHGGRSGASAEGAAARTRRVFSQDDSAGAQRIAAWKALPLLQRE